MLSEQERMQWATQGYVFGKGVLPQTLLQTARGHMQELYDKKELQTKQFGSQGKLEFPCNSIIDDLTLHPNILNNAKALLGTDDILLSQSDAWGKHGRVESEQQSNNDQRMHMDYGNHTFLHVAPWDQPQVVAMIVYLSDIKVTGGGTAVVPRKGSQDEAYNRPYTKMPGQGGILFKNNRTAAEQHLKKEHPEIHAFRQKLYQREIISQPGFGDVLFYRLDIWHRGTPVKVGQVRFVVNLAFKRKQCTWINVWNPGITKNMYYGWLEDFVTRCSTEQRAVIGFFKPGDPYWTKERLEMVAARYPKMDLQCYYEQLPK